jgi:hypothetical protein
MKTLLEYHYETRIEALSNDLDNGYAKRMVIIEMLANQYGWKHLCEAELINKHITNIYNA